MITICCKQKKQYNNDKKKQIILREWNILYLRKKTHGRLKLKLIGQKRVVKHAEQTGKTTAIRRIAVRETSALRCNGDLNDGPPDDGPSLHYGIEGSKGAPICVPT